MAARTATAFGTLMSGLRGVLETLNPDGGDAPIMDQRALALSLLPTVGRADRLVRRLRAYAADQSLSPVKLEPVPFLRDLAHLLRRALDVRIDVSVDLDPDCPPCYVDAEALEEALLNLVANARDAMPEGGSLRLSAKAATAPDGSPAVAVSVVDTGTGMATDFAPRAMQPFATTKPDDPLAGMGLAATEGFARQSGGSLTLSCPAGFGMTATLSLPQSASNGSSARGLAVGRSDLLAMTKDIIQSASDAIAATDEGQSIAMGGLYTVILRDMSERRVAEAALRESEARLQRVLTLLPDAVVVNSGGHISFINEATQQLFGADAAALLGRSASELFQPDSVVVEKARVLSLQSSPGGSLVDERIVRADGAERIGQVAATLIEDRGEVSILAVIRDVTELRQTRSALAQAHADLQRLFTAHDRIQEEERSRIARELHDDLQQPLAAIRMNVHEIGECVMTNPSVAPLLVEVDRLASSAVESTRRILNDLRPQVLEHLGLTPALDMLARQFSQHSGIVCTLEAQAGVDNALVDLPMTSTCLYRVAQEALNNVRKHAGASAVQIRLGTAGEGRWMLWIADDGCGMSDRRAGARSGGRRASD